jgi:acid phosphatase
LLYNREEIEIPHCPEGATLERFASEVLGPFLLSQAEATEACRVAVQHEGAMPQPSKQHIGMGGSDDKGE